METYDVDVGGVKYTLRKLSGFQLMHTMGGVGANGQTRSAGEMYRDLIHASLVTPKLTKPEIETLDFVPFTDLGTVILEKHKVDVEDFRVRAGGTQK